MTSNCVYPATANTSQIQAAYTNWKNTFVTASGTPGSNQLRVVDPNDATTPQRTVSEGIGYGMIIAVYMTDKPLLDSLWAYEQALLDANGLMRWLIDMSGNPVRANEGGATDADEDMAWALVMADRQWPNSGYLDAAKAQIQKIFSLEINPNGSQLRWGDGSTAASQHPDYFSPAYYRVFGNVTANTSGWNAVISAGYALLRAARNGTTGLVPDLCQASGAATANPADAVYGYDACRTPWRVGIDWCFNASTDAQGILAPLAGYFAGVGTVGIKGPVGLDGTPTAMSYANAEFTGPAGISAMVTPSDQSFLDQAWTRTYGQTQQAATNNPIYFAASVGMVSMLVMSGNFIDYTQ